MSDRSLHDEIMNELDFEPRINAAHNGIAFSALGFPQFAETNPQNARPVELGTLGGPVSSRIHRRKPV